ncbi:MAG: TAXI family TRAP transporter solute-binding subunit [Deltaproteobacteria bacterium]|nr:TAXI family TRAP transporter solute-binding subunit [Deltaproteobacteria bacterium]
MNVKSFFLTLAAMVLVSSTVIAQTVGIGATKSGYTSQASAAIAKLISKKTDIQMRVQPYGGSSAYVPLVSGGKLEFGLANEIEAASAVAGTGIYDGRPQPDLQVAALLQPFRVAVYTRKDSNIRTVADLKGKRVPSGWVSQKIIGVLMDGQLANAGLTYDDVIQVPTPNVVGGANDFAAGKTDVFFFVFGAGKVKETEAKVGGLRVVGIDPSPEAVERMRKHVGPSYALQVKPSKVNVGVDEPVNVMAYDYLMLTHGKVSPDVVYKVVKAMHGNKKDLVAAFRGMSLFSPSHMTKTIPGVNFHEGAIKFYKEIGQWPPK